MADKKLTFEQMEFIYQAAIQAANKTLFVENFEQHGWTEKEFTQEMLWTLKAIQEGKIQRWVN